MFELFTNLYTSRQYVIQTFSYQFIKFAANLITLRRSCSFAEYWKHFMARLNGVYAEVNRSGWNLGHSEYIVCRWPWQILGAIRHRNERARGNFLSGKQRAIHRLPVGQISRNLHTARGSVSRWILSERIFENFPVWGLFFQKGNFSSMTSDFSPP